MLMVFLVPILLFVVCYIMGDFLQMFFKFKSGFALKVIVGYLLIIGIFHLISLPFMYLETAFTPLFWLYLGVICLIVIVYVIFSINKRQINIKLDLIQLYTSLVNNKKNIIWWIIVIILIGFQMLKVYTSVHPNIDDQFYVSQITTMLDRNRIMDIMPSSGEGLFDFPEMYKMVSFETWLGFICKLFGVAPAILCHTIIPLFFIPLTYIVMFKVGKEIVGEKAGIFMIFIALLNIFSGYSAYTQGAFLLLRIWQGKAIMVNIIFPLLLYVFVKIMKANKVNLNYGLFLFALLLTAFHTSTVGVIFIPICYGIYTITYFVYSRSIKEFLKLCIPVLFVVPLVIQKFLMLFSSTSVDAFGEGVDKLVYKDVLYEFLRESHMLLFLVIAFVFLIIRRKKIVSYMIVLYSALLFFLILNPFLSYIIATKLTGVAVYWRVFWLLQSSIVIAIALTEVTSMIKKIIPKILMLLCCVWLVIFSGYTMFNDRYFPPGKNLAIEDEDLPEEYVFQNPKDIDYEEDYDHMYKLSLFTLQISDIIMNIKEKENLDTVNLLLTEKKSLEIRQYADINLICFFYSNEYYEGAGLIEEQEKLIDLYTTLYIYKKWTATHIMKELEYFDVDFVVMLVSAIEKNPVPEEFTKLYQDETYILYRVNR